MQLRERRPRRTPLLFCFVRLFLKSLVRAFSVPKAFAMIVEAHDFTDDFDAATTAKQTRIEPTDSSSDEENEDYPCLKRENLVFKRGNHPFKHESRPFKQEHTFNNQEHTFYNQEHTFYNQENIFFNQENIFFNKENFFNQESKGNNIKFNHQDNFVRYKKRAMLKDSYDCVPYKRLNVWEVLSPYFEQLKESAPGLSVCLLFGGLFLCQKSLTYLVFYPLFRLLFGTLYPAYASYKAVKTKNFKEYVSNLLILHCYSSCSFL